MNAKNLVPPYENLGSIPWLLFTHSYYAQTFSTSPFNNKAYLKNIPILQSKTIHASQFGWLILLDDTIDDDDCYSVTLWNPVTSKSIKLPPLTHRNDEVNVKKILLTSPPCDDDDASNSCFVFVFFFGIAFFYSIKGHNDSSHWVSNRLEIEGERVRILFGVALNNGDIYGWASETLGGRINRLVLIQVVDDGTTFELRPLSITLPNTYFSHILAQCCNYMIESNGSIYIAQVGTRDYDGVVNVKVFEIDLDRGVCIDVKCLGDHAFFLSDNATTWSLGNDDFESNYCNVQRDCLYIYLWDIAKDAVILYRLKDCSTTFLPSPILHNPLENDAFWVMPQHPRYIAQREHKEDIQNDDDDYHNSKSSSLVINATECSEPKTEEQGTYLSELPLHMIELLSKYMHLFDCWNFSCTSKLNRLATPTPGWRTNNSFPLLLVFVNDTGLCRLMDPCRDDFRSCIFQLSDKYFDIEFSKNGWLLVSDGKQLQFLNPFTKERGVMLHPKRYYDSIGFSTYPTCSNYWTVAITYSFDNMIIIDYIQSGDLEWKSHSFENNNVAITFRPGFGCPVYHLGAFYFLDMVGYLGVFEVVDGEARWCVYEKPFAKSRKFHSCYLVESDEKLLSVFIGDKAKYIRVFRFNHSTKNWAHVKSLGNFSLFISPYASFSIANSDMKMNNRIYFPWMKEKGIVYYSLESRKYRVDGCELPEQDIFFLKQPSRCCWI